MTQPREAGYKHHHRRTVTEPFEDILRRGGATALSHAGQFPGDGKPKPVAFPDPSSVGVEIDGVRYLNLPTLIELKLASGMTNPGRLKDLADVQELIRVLQLPIEFADGLNPFVRSKYSEVWSGVQQDRPGEPLP